MALGPIPDENDFVLSQLKGPELLHSSVKFMSKKMLKKFGPLNNKRERKRVLINSNLTKRIVSKVVRKKLKNLNNMHDLAF